MAKYPHMPVATDAYLGDTKHLTTLQHGIYFLLLLVAWRSPDVPRLPADEKLLARYAGVDPRTWRANRDVVMAFWTLGDDGHWTQKKQMAIREIVRKNVEKAKEKANRRWHPKPLENNDTVDAAAMPEPCWDDAIQNQTPLRESSDTIVSGAERAPLDPRKELFSAGMAYLMGSTGKTRQSLGRIVGMWLSTAKDDARKVLEKVRAAEAKEVADPIAWVTAALNGDSEYDFIWKRGA